MEKNFDFVIQMQVRDYECDLEGIVNNANYLHYLEHTRHEYIKQKGLSFARLHEEGIDLVVARINIAYKTPLRSDDEFISGINITKEGMKYVFHHEIYRVGDEKLCIRAKVESVSIVNGKLANYPPLEALLKN